MLEGRLPPEDGYNRRETLRKRKNVKSETLRKRKNVKFETLQKRKNVKFETLQKRKNAKAQKRVQTRDTFSLRKTAIFIKIAPMARPRGILCVDKIGSVPQDRLSLSGIIVFPKR